MKTFELDWDDETALRKHLNVIKSRLGEIKTAPRRECKRQQFDACRKILESNIDSCFSGMLLSTEQVFYVYAHLDPTRKIALGRDAATTFAASIGMEFFPFYVGKGTGNRCQDLNRNETHRKIRQKISSLEKEPIVVKIAEGLTELEALAMESKLIDIFGLIPLGGILSNLDEGINKEARRDIYRDSFTSLRRLNNIL